MKGRSRRALGQHFLVDEGVASATVALAEIDPEEPVLEIGPGHGVLTRVLLEAGARVVAVEIDEDLARGLTKLESSALRVEHADFLRLDLERVPERTLKVVANLPYASGTAILERLLRHRDRFSRIVVMLQREVAERVCAEPGSRAYGSLSVLTAVYASAHLAFSVPPSAFRPPPKVHSAVVRLDVSVEPRIATDAAVLRRVVRVAFAQRRKTLRNALAAGLGGRRAEAILVGAAIEPGRRAETLSLEEFARLAEEMKRHA